MSSDEEDTASLGDIYEELDEINENLLDKKSEILDEKGLAMDMKTMIDQIQGILQVNQTTARILLQKCNWDSEKLMEQLCTVIYGAKHIFTPSTNLLGECIVCFEKCDLSLHSACSTCWAAYFKKKIVGEGRTEIQCLDPQCNALMDDEEIAKFIDEKTFAKLQKLIINEYVASNKQLKWCPGVDCGMVVKRLDPTIHTIQCSCGLIICFDCGHESHFPLDCKHLKRWLATEKENKASINPIIRWNYENFRSCPICGTPNKINHWTSDPEIRCQVPECQKLYCWRCLGNCTSDSPLCMPSCLPEVQMLTFGKSKHYAKFYKLYLEQEYLLDQESKLKPSDASLTSLAPPDQYFKETMDLLRKSRQTLMMSSIFLYFLVPENAQTNLYEEKVDNLKQAADHFSKQLMSSLYRKDYPKWMKKIQETSEEMIGLLSNLHWVYESGKANDLWVFNE